jgi:DNA polymerase IV
MRILCAQYPHLALVSALRRFPELRGEPVIVGSAAELRLPVITASRPALASGVRAGQPLRQAQQLCPAAAFVTVDAAAMASLRDALRMALHRLAPAVEVSDSEAFCDLSGRHAAHVDEAAWAIAAARGLGATLDPESTGVEPPRIGVAGSRFVARLAARQSRPGRIRRVRDGDEAAFVAPLPLNVLPIDPKIAARLAGFGLDCLGAVAGLSPADLQRQFGPDAQPLCRLVRGQDYEGIQGESVPLAWSERLVLDGAVADLEVLLQAARRCAGAIGGRLADRALAAADVKVEFEVDERPPIAASVVTPVPAGNAEETWTAVLGLLGELHPEAPVTAVRVEVSGLVPAEGRQTDMWRSGDATRDAVAAVAGRLRARFGEAAARRPRLALDPGDLPERRFVWDAPVVSAATR